MELPHVTNCELEWRRQRTFYFHSNARDRAHAEEDVVPVVELKPFTKKVWRKSHSRPLVSNIVPFLEKNYTSDAETPRINPQFDHRYSQDSRRLDRDTIILLAEFTTQKPERISSSPVSTHDERKKRVPGGPKSAIKQFRQTSLRNRTSLAMDDIKFGKARHDPQMLIRGEPFVDLSPSEYYIKTRSKSMPSYFPKNSSKRRYQNDNSESNVRNDMNARGHVMFTCKPPPLVINNYPLFAELRTSLGINYSVDVKYLPMSSASENVYSLDSDGINNEYTKIVRRSKISNSATDHVIMKTFGAPTQGEISLKLGMFQNLSKTKLRDVARKHRLRHGNDDTKGDKETEPVMTDDVRDDSHQSFDKSHFDSTRAQNPNAAQYIDQELLPSKLKSGKSRSIAAHDGSMEEKVDSGNDAATLHEVVTPSRPGLLSVSDQSDKESEENIATAEITLIKDSEAEEQELGINDDIVENHSLLHCHKQRTFMTATSREGTPLNSAREWSPRADDEVSAEEVVSRIEHDENNETEQTEVSVRESSDLQDI